MTFTVQRTIQLEEIACPTCGRTMFLSSEVIEKLRKSKETFYCPAGHRQGYYGKNSLELQVDRLETRAATLERQRDNAIESCRNLSERDEVRREKERLRGRRRRKAAKRRRRR